MKLNISQYKQEEIEIIISNANKAIAFSNLSYPLNNLDDRLFEVLTYSIFKNRIINEDKKLKKRFDDVSLMQGVGEKGMDCILIKKDKIASVIQCKKYQTNLTDTTILTELIKFSIHAIQNVSDFNFTSKFTYYIATSTGYTRKSILLPNLLTSGKFKDIYDIQTITQKLIKKYKEFERINYFSIENSLIEFLKSLHYELIRPEDINLWINDYPNLIEAFFEIKKVTDNELINTKSNEIISTVKELLTPKPESKEINDFLQKYKSIAREKLNIVNFIGFDIQKHRQRPDDITLTDLFVQPSFRQRANERNDKIFSVAYNDLKITNLFKTEKNIVILGDPGAGKSLLVKFIIVSILNDQSAKIGLRQFENYFPLRIELRKYNEVREKLSLIEYISDVLNKDFQTKISSTQLEAIIDNYPSLIFFDGLDEIFNISHKTKIKDGIETFGIRFKLAKCVVTSRFIGYHDIKFNSKKFDEFAILKFNSLQIKELVTKFYQTQQASLEKRINAIENCTKQIYSEVDEELKSNPLILTLILILTSNNIVIPDSKLEIYESCTKTLVDSIDIKDKELTFELPVKNKNLTFSHLAYWQYETQSSDIEITFLKAVKTIADFLLLRKEVSDYNEAESKSEKFLEYAERRSIYFENNFTHKTFLEYFTAEYLYSNCIAKASDEGRKRLISIVNKYLASPFWYIVFELLFTRIDRVQPDNELLDEIFSKQAERNLLDVLYFLIANLGKFNNVSQEVKSSIIERTLLLCLKGEKMKDERKESLRFEENSLIYKLYSLSTNSENHKILQEVFYRLESDGLKEKQEIELYNLYYEIISFNYRKNTPNTLQIRNKSRIKELALNDLLLFSNYYLKRDSNKDRIDVEILITQIENFGQKSLFNYIPLRHISNTRKIDTFDLYLIYIIEACDIESLKIDLQKLKEHGLTSDMILNHVKDTRLLYYTRSEGLSKILKLYLKSDDKLIDTILEKVIRSDREMKLAYDKIRLEDNNPKLKNIDKIFAAKK